jgi:hypothetical protein
MAITLAGIAWTVGACGGAAGLADPGACPAPAAALTNDSSDGAYRTAVIRGIELIQEIDQRFRQAWEERRLRERAQFRADFAAYAHATACELEVMAGLRAPALGPLAEFETGLQAVVAEYLGAMEAGREAVEKRNSSAYNDWVKQVDALAVALGERREELLAGD